jgi:pilus assembly protein CpaC
MKTRFPIFVSFVALGAFVSHVAFAQPRVSGYSEATEFVELQVGETKLLHVTHEIIRIAVANPEVADAQAVTQSQVLITAENVGSTHIIFWDANDQPLVVSVEVNRNLDQLRGQLEKLFPGEQIEVSAAGELLVLSGQVSDLRLPSRAADLAGLYSEQLANLIEVEGDQQVQLEVRFAEVSRTALRRLGLNILWQGGDAGPFVSGQPAPGVAGAILPVPGTGSPAQPALPGPVFREAFNLFFSSGLTDFPFGAVLSILAREGLANTLAEPTLVAHSGQEASFHAGGELPILIARDLGQTTVEFKEFGVRLDFVPTVLGGGSISLKLAVEVSEPDPTNSVTLAGFSIPGFRTRQSATTIRVEDGQSFAIAGLLSDEVRSVADKVPLLGDIPILGTLFRSTAFQREETELLVVVQAKLVRPIDAADAPRLPGEDELTEPTDFELFLLGRTRPVPRNTPETRGQTATPARSSVGELGPAGPIGFMREL